MIRNGLTAVFLVVFYSQTRYNQYMPLHKIHLVLAEELNRTLQVDHDSLLLGSLLPDLAVSRNHRRTHFESGVGYAGRLADPDRFLEIYGARLDVPIYLGYLLHLLADHFYNDYYYQHHCLFHRNGLPRAVRLKTGGVSIYATRYKHGDLAKYEKWLLNHGRVPLFTGDTCVSHVRDLRDDQFDRQELRDYIARCNREVKYPRQYAPFGRTKIKIPQFYRVLSQKELEQMLAACVDYCQRYLQEHNLVPD